MRERAGDLEGTHCTRCLLIEVPKYREAEGTGWQAEFQARFKKSGGPFVKGWLFPPRLRDEDERESTGSGALVGGEDGGAERDTCH